MDSVDKSVIGRIEQAANELYVENNQERFPTVDAVRRRAKVDMNTASLVMKDWRKKQLSKAAPAVVDVPKELSEIFSHSIKSIWEQAQAIANESLKLAQQNWENERQEAEGMTAEISKAFDEQTLQLEEAAKENSKLKEQLRELNLAKEKLLMESESVRGELTAAKEQLAEKTGAVDAYKEQLLILKNLIESRAKG